jgi:hypothetical protein
MKGKMHLLNKLRLLYLIKSKAITRTRITIMGVVPEFQKAGVESGIFWHMDKVMKKKPHYTEVELSWVGDFNPKMAAIHEAVGGKFAKRHITYRKLFSNEKLKKRATGIPLGKKK